MLLESETVRLAGAGCDNVIANGTAAPRPTVVLAGTFTAPAFWTVTLVVALAMFGAAAVAVMVAGPTATAVTGTLTEVAPAGMLTLAGTVAIFVLLEVR